jgi:hypothetical protein
MGTPETTLQPEPQKACNEPPLIAERIFAPLHTTLPKQHSWLPKISFSLQADIRPKAF